MFDQKEREAFERTAPLREALEKVKLPRYTLDAAWAAGRARNIVERLEPFRAEIARLPHFDMAHLDRLPDLSLALPWVNTHIFLRRARGNDLPALTEEARTLRAILMAYADLLVLTGELHESVVRRLRRGRSRLDIVSDLNVLQIVFTERVPLGPSAPVEVATLVRAGQVAQVLGVAHVSRGSDLKLRELLLDRARLGHLLLQSHGQLRRAMAYLRYPEDVDRWVPSLYVPKKG